MKLLLTHPVKEKELYGIQVSTRALEKLTPQEIRDLRVVFEAFDIHERGYECWMRTWLNELSVQMLQ